jgi:hypothetical protein
MFKYTEWVSYELKSGEKYEKFLMWEKITGKIDITIRMNVFIHLIRKLGIGLSNLLMDIIKDEKW